MTILPVIRFLRYHSNTHGLRQLGPLFLLLLPLGAGAQSVRGIVVGRTDSTAVPGAVVLLLDAAGTVAGRALTNERGEYRLTAPGAGSYAIRTTRIGFRPVTSARIELASGADLVHAPIVAGAPVMLDTVRVVGRNQCRVHGDSAVATYALWEQVRTALTAVDLTARARTMAATIVIYERSTDPGSGRVRSQSAGVRSGFTERPWVSRSVDSLRQFGYVSTGLQGWVTYYAPDLELLLSNVFLEDHCFRLARRSTTQLIGLEFEPTDARRDLPEIRGIVWLDRRSAELRRMEFRYTNLAREQERHAAGGEMEFVRMKNGAWAIARWHIRMPVVMEREAAQPSLVPGMPARAERRVTEVRVGGGELSLIALGSDTLWARPPLSVRGHVVDSTSGTPVAEARVALKGTALATTTDSGGNFALSGVLPGEYTLEVGTAAMDSAGLVQQSTVILTDADTPLLVRLRRRSVFHGYVVSELGGQPIPGATVALPEVGMSARAREDGMFRLLDVPPGLHTVAVRQPGFTGLNAKIAFGPQEIVSQRFALQLEAVPVATVATALRTSVREFEERRERGVGHFITRADLEKRKNYRTADVLSGVPGLRVIRSPAGQQAWATSGRGRMSIENERAPDRNSNSLGAPNACYTDVYMDGVLVYGGSGSDLFDLNSVLPAILEGVEFFTASQVPPEYNRNGSACGVLLFWTRRG